MGNPPGRVTVPAQLGSRALFYDSYDKLPGLEATLMFVTFSESP